MYQAIREGGGNSMTLSIKAAQCGKAAIFVFQEKKILQWVGILTMS